jgi:photosystem II stability/assembly factor-like uncharacterized protein
MVALVAFVLGSFLQAQPPSPAQAPDRWLLAFVETSATHVRLQAVSVVSDDVAWVSGLEGTFGRTTDGGNTWEIGVVEGAEELQFRDLHAVSSEVAYLLSAGPGTQSRIYKTMDGGKSWALQFANDEPEGFFDCMDFWDASHGLAYGDSVRGELVVLATEDGGTWRPVPQEALPRARDGEGGFAASGTCVVTQGDSVAYIATGAGSARVLRTSDRGRSWDSFATPVVGDSETSGLTSVAFAKTGDGLAAGGDISTPESTQPNVAVTSDGGGSWQLATSPFLGPVYGVAGVPGTSPPVFVAVGPKGAAYTRDGAVSWTALSDESFWSVGFGPSGRGYMVGPDGRITRLEPRFRAR